MSLQSCREQGGGNLPLLLSFKHGLEGLENADPGLFSLGIRPTKQKKNLYMTQLEQVSNLTILASGETVEPLVVGVDTPAPPTKEYSSLDQGNVFGVPNAVLSISEVNPRLEPQRYGLDFWESLSAELVSLTDVQAVSRPSDYGEIWVRGGWRVTGENDHGGMTMLTGGQ